jgi:hypothetical protein
MYKNQVETNKTIFISRVLSPSCLTVFLNTMSTKACLLLKTNIGKINYTFIIILIVKNILHINSAKMYRNYKFPFGTHNFYSSEKKS